MTTGFIEWVAGVGGIGAVFAVLMFYIYRHDTKRMEKAGREDRKFMEDRLTSVLDNYNNAVQENTRVNGELYSYLKARNGGK